MMMHANDRSCVASARLVAFAGLAFAGLLLSDVGSAHAQNAEASADGWTTLDPASGTPMKRHENAYAKVGDKFYLMGGRGERPVQIYDPETDTWTTGATPPTTMHHFQAVPYDGTIYVLSAFSGGYPSEGPLAHVYLYHPDEDRWERGPEIPEDRRRGAAGAVAYQDKLYVVGGIQNGHRSGQVRWMDAFDPETGEWTRLPDAPRRRDHFQAGVIDGTLYAAGGRRTSAATDRTFELTIPEVDRYDFSEGEWETLPPAGDLPTERAGTTTVTAGGRLIVIGGESGSQPEAHAEVEAFNPETGEWRSLPPMNQGRHGTQALVHDGTIYVAAGSKTRGATEINSQERLALPDTLAE